MNFLMLIPSFSFFSFFFFNDTATTEIYTLSLHDALPIFGNAPQARDPRRIDLRAGQCQRSEEHTSELQSPYDIICRLLLEKKKNKANLIVHQKQKENKYDINKHIIKQ